MQISDFPPTIIRSVQNVFGDAQHIMLFALPVTAVIKE